MPEIGEVARIVSYIHKHLVGKTLAVVKAQHDENVFGKVGTTAAEFEKALMGKKILDAGQQGKYFWLIMSSPPHPVFHFGMAGWWKIRNEETAYYKPTKPEESIWPPKYWKFTLETAEKPKCEAAFVDLRRFARIRLLDCVAEDIRQTSPLVENGPDPVIDRDIVTEEWLAEKMASKKIPVKALLLDQANISGIGNWVGDEILYDAQIHPEQYSNTLTPEQIHQLHTSILHITSTAVSTLADSSQFPETWLFKHRWGKGKKDAPKNLPNGAKIEFVTVGGRTSAVIPSVQKKTGAVTGEAKKKGGKKKTADDAVDDDAEDGEEDAKNMEGKKPEPNKKKPTRARGKKAETAESETREDNDEDIANGATTIESKPTAPSKKNPIKSRSKKATDTRIETADDDDDDDDTNPAPLAQKKATTKKRAAPPSAAIPAAESSAPAPKKRKQAPKRQRELSEGEEVAKRWGLTGRRGRVIVSKN
ncbi:hypothetical protein MMC12_000220 [Toensbergia leucococca]|nr:hypothetical protein [Toensbergia leucococca]